MFVSNRNTYAQNCLIKSALCYFISVVFSEPDKSNKIIGGLDEDFQEYFIRSFRGVSPSKSRRSTLEEQNAGHFQEPPVMDKPGLFFPDDINPWSSWSSCLGEIQTRARGPLEMAKLMKCGHLECLQTRPCQSPTAPVLLQWGTWGQWSECISESGGNSARTRVRQCQGQSVRSDGTAKSALNHVMFSPSCPGLAIERLACDNQFKPAEVSQWANWSPWSKCERGRQFRTSSCTGSYDRCTTARYETQLCSTHYNSGIDRTWRQENPCARPFNFRNCRLMPSNNDQPWRHSRQPLWRN